MKKFFFTLAMLAASFLAFTACEEEEGTGEITVSDAASKELIEHGVSFASASDGGSLTASLSFDAPAPWSATVGDATKAEPWLTVDPASGEAGPATITVTAQENTSEEERSATVTITSGDLSLSFNVSQQAGLQQPAPVVTIELDKTEVEMTVGETLQLNATATSSDPVAPTVKWSSSDTAVATVTAENDVAADGTYLPGGLVTAVGEGEAIITAKAGDAEATCKVTVVGGTVVVTVTEIKLDKQEIHMSPGQTVQITATVKPEEAAGSVTWSSSHAGVASVDQDGKVTAKALGETVITASAGDKSASCLVKVEEEVVIEGITLNEISLTLKEGETFQLVATLLPETATPKPIEWFSSIPAVATVDDNGLVTAVRKGGPALIWAVVNRGTYLETAVKCEVTVTSDAPAIESITVTPGKVTINYGEETILTATVKPEGTGAVINWVSDNTGFVKVEKISDTQAKVTGVGIGTTKVIASVGDVFDYCEVTVEKKNGGEGGEAESISLNHTSLEMSIGQTAQLTATVVPESAAGSVVWSSSNARVASVSNGLVVAQSSGEAEITATAGSVSASCKVIVRSSGGGSTLESVSIDPPSVTLQLNEEKILTLVMVPSDAEVTIYWESANQYIAYVQMISMTQAKVKGVSVGETTVTVHAGDKTATCAVKVEDPTGTNVPVESVSLNKTELTLSVGQQFQLIATVLPEEATNKEVVWSSSVPSSKLYIDTNGMVSALAECEATVTVRCKANAYISASCKVTVTGGGSSGSDEEVVDLGLSVKWRSMNVGASKPEDYGNYYAWGETATKSSYSWSNYKFGHSQNGEFSKYDTGPYADNKTVLDPEDDAAAVNLGNGWRMATYKEWKELREQCTWKWTTRNGVNGMQVTGPSGKSIFLPAAGWYDTSMNNRGSYGSYWTATVGGVQGMANAVDFISSGFDVAVIARCRGNSIRPVKD